MCWDLVFWLVLLFARGVTNRRLGFLIDAIVVAAFFHEGIENIISIEVHWRYFPFYALFSILLFLASLWLTSTEPLSYLRSVVQLLGRQHWVQQRRIVRNSLLVAAYEELIWRVLLQTALANAGGVILSVVLVAVTFTLWHWHRIKNSTAQQLELLIFSLVLGSFYALLHDPLLLLLSHSLRNYLVESNHYYARTKNAY